MASAVYNQSSSKIQEELDVLIWQLLADDISKAQVHALAGQPPFPGAPPRPAPAAVSFAQPLSTHAPRAAAR